jgi:phi13 family phage major tail protein
MFMVENKLTSNPVIGLDMAHYAILVNDPTLGEPGSGKPEYREPVPLSDTKAIRVASSDNTDTHYYDNVPRFTVTAKGEKTVNFVRAGFTNEEKQVLLGYEKDGEGATIEGSESNPPYIAFGFRRMVTGGHYEYVWYLKGQMSMNEENTETREKNVSIQERTMVGTFIPRLCDNKYVRRVCTADPGVEPALIKKWFTREAISLILKAAEAPANSVPGDIPDAP